MRINNSYGLDPRDLQSGNLRPEKGGKARAGSPSAGAQQAAATGGAAQASYISMAMEVDEVRPPAVDKARRLLDAGELDTPEMAAKTAEAIVERGL
ncbi:MAG: hypothetical protein ACOC93_01255 [Planctomycetota bacterium]